MSKKKKSPSTEYITLGELMGTHFMKDLETVLKASKVNAKINKKKDKKEETK